MSDNVQLPGTGAVIATDDVGGVQYQIVKFAYGADGVATPIDFMPASQATLAAMLAAFKQEDTPHVNGDLGMPVFGMRYDADSTTVGTDGDYSILKLDENGRLKVSTQPATYLDGVGNITANGQSVFLNVERASNITVTVVSSSLVGHNATFEFSNNSTNGTDGNWYSFQVVRTNANTIDVATGTVTATPTFGWEASVNAYKWVRVRATSHTSGTATYTIKQGTYATEPIPAAQIHNVIVNGGSSAIGDVGLIVRPNATTSALIAKVNSTATTNATSVKSSAARLVGMSLQNTSAAVKYLKFFNKASAPTLGTDTPVWTVAVPANGSREITMPVGIGFTVGLAYAITNLAGDTDNTDVSAGDVIGALFYA